LTSFGQLKEKYNDAPKSIESLGEECTAIENVLVSLETFIKNTNRDVKQDEDLCKQVSEVIKGTEDVMSQLQLEMDEIVRPGEQGAWEKRLKRLPFMGSDREIQATHKLLHARKQSLELILTCWTRFVTTLEEPIRLLTLPSSDGERMRNELDKIRTTLEQSLSRSHWQALLNGFTRAAGSSSESVATSSKSPKSVESVTEYDKTGELSTHLVSSVICVIQA
jgi:hypothetical protein